jgi:hypothetical protein
MASRRPAFIADLEVLLIVSCWQAGFPKDKIGRIAGNDAALEFKNVFNDR